MRDWFAGRLTARERINRSASSPMSAYTCSVKSLSPKICFCFDRVCNNCHPSRHPGTWFVRLRPYSPEPRLCMVRLISTPRFCLWSVKAWECNCKLQIQRHFGFLILELCFVDWFFCTMLIVFLNFLAWTYW